MFLLTPLCRDGSLDGQLAQPFHMLFCFMFPTHTSSLLSLGPLFPSLKIPSKLSPSTWENLPSPSHLSWRSWTTTWVCSTDWTVTSYLKTQPSQLVLLPASLLLELSNREGDALQPLQGINRAPCCAFAALPLSPHPVPSSQTSWFTVDFWHVSEAKRTVSCQLHLWKLLNTIFLAWEMLLWPFQASLLWCLRTWLQAVKPLWPISQGGNCYRKLSWARTTTSGTASPTDCPAQKVGKIGHLAKDPNRTVCVCVRVYVCACVFQNSPLTFDIEVGSVNKPRNWAALTGKHVCVFVLRFFLWVFSSSAFEYLWKPT